MKNDKTSLKEVRKADLLRLDKSLTLTLEDVMGILSVKDQTAKLILGDLETDLQLIKYGRGKKAYWKFHD